MVVEIRTLSRMMELIGKRHEGIIIFYCCTTSYHKLSSLNNIRLVLSYRFYRSEIWASHNWVLNSGLYKDEAQMSAGAELSSEVQNHLKFLCLTDFHPELIQMPKSQPQVLALWPLHRQFTYADCCLMDQKTKVCCCFLSFLWLPD